MRANPEQLLISSLLRNGDIGIALKRGIKRDMFHVYKDEWEWIEKFYLTRSKCPSKAAFVSTFPTFRLKVVDDTEHFADEVRNEHAVVEVVNSLASVMEQAKARNGRQALTEMFNSSMRIGNDLGLVVDGDVFSDNDDIISDFALRRERYERMGASGIPTGFATFDERTGGLAPGEFHVWAARLGGAKSYSAQNVAKNAALAGYKVLYYALEQPRANVMARIIPLVSGSAGKKIFTSQNLIRGNGYDPVEFMEFMHELRTKIKGNLHVVDTSHGRISTVDIAAGIERNKPDLLVVDHLTLVSRNTNDHLGTAEVADELNSFSMQYDIPVLALSQLNRQGAQKGAGPETIAESDKIGQNAAGIVFIQKMSKRVIKYSVEKSRNSEGGFGWWVKFAPDRGVFSEIDYEIAQELMEEDEMEKELMV